MSEKKLLSTAELAKMLGISRVAVFKRIQKGEIKAIKVGRSYVIPVEDILGRDLTEEEKQEINAAVNRTVAEYGEVLKKLGRKLNDSD